MSLLTTIRLRGLEVEFPHEILHTCSEKSTDSRPEISEFSDSRLIFYDFPKWRRSENPEKSKTGLPPAKLWHPHLQVLVRITRCQTPQKEAWKSGRRRLSGRRARAGAVRGPPPAPPSHLQNMTPVVTRVQPYAICSSQNGTGPARTPRVGRELDLTRESPPSCPGLREWKTFRLAEPHVEDVGISHDRSIEQRLVKVLFWKSTAF